MPGKERITKSIKWIKQAAAAIDQTAAAAYIGLLDAEHP